MNNLISFYNRVTCLIDEGKAVNIIYTDSVKHLMLFPMAFPWRSWQPMA